MRLHEIVAEYHEIGVHNTGLMIELSEAGFEPQQVSEFWAKGLIPSNAVAYNRAGLTDVGDMLKYHAAEVPPWAVEKYFPLGFNKLEEIKCIIEKKLDQYGHAIPVFAKHCGFQGNLDAIVELVENGIDWTYAWELSKHGLAGKKEDMLYIGKRVDSVKFRELTNIIANRSAGASSPDSATKDNTYLEAFRYSINPFDIVSLAESPEGKAFLSQKVFKTNYEPCLGDDSLMVSTYLKQSEEDHAKCSHRDSTHQLYLQIQNKREETLFEAYKAVRDQRKG